MDGTLLDATGAIPAKFWPLLDRARERGVVVAPASGRQLATLRAMFAHAEPEAFIAENGAVVWHRGRIVSTTAMDEAPVRRLVAALAGAPFTAYPVVCTPQVAYVGDDLPPEVAAEVAKYYAAREQRASLADAPLDQTVKIALYVAAGAEGGAEGAALPWVREMVPELRAVVSSEHWLDVMDPAADKGTALRDLARALGVGQRDTAAIGDYLNDAGMLREAGYAVAMGNAHPDLKAIADEVVGTNAEGSAVDKLEAWLQT